MGKFKIGVFTSKGKNKLKYRAYSTYYNPEWTGCRVIEIEAPNGTIAKKNAIDIVKKMDLKSMGKVNALIHSQRVYDNTETFDIHLNELENNKEIVLECRDKEHAIILAKLISQCVNYVDNYAILKNTERGKIGGD